MAGSLYIWQLTHEPPDGPSIQIPIHLMTTGPQLQMSTMNHIIFHILVADIIQEFPVVTFLEPPHNIILDYPQGSEMLNGFIITLAGHGACTYTQY